MNEIKGLTDTDMCPLIDMSCNMLDDRLELKEVVYKDYVENKPKK
jgi:hypothetical protein